MIDLGKTELVVMNVDIQFSYTLVWMRRHRNYVFIITLIIDRFMKIFWQSTCLLSPMIWWISHQMARSEMDPPVSGLG
jgi:hypothetical protein